MGCQARPGVSQAGQGAAEAHWIGRVSQHPKSLKGGLVEVGGLNLGGSIEPIYNAVGIVEAAADKGAKTILLPVTTRKQLVELDDDIATRVTVVFYGDARDALFKALVE